MLRKVFDQFIEDLLQKNDKETTASSYYTLATNHILNKFNDRDMSSISEDELLLHLTNEKSNHLRCADKELGPKTIYDITTLINSLWAFAFKKGYIKQKIHISVPKVSKRKIDVFSGNEKRKIEDYILEHPAPFEIAILLCLYTGLRIGEVCALKWRDIDLGQELIHVSKTIIRIKNIKSNGPKTKVIIGLPKSEASMRPIPIPAVIIGLLKQAKSQDDDYIATNSDFFMEPRLLQKRYKTLLKRAAVTYKNPHTLRHTFATNAYTKGMGIKSLSEILGHADIKTTLNLYVHPTMEQKQKEMNQIYLNEPLLT